MVHPYNHFKFIILFSSFFILSCSSKEIVDRKEEIKNLHINSWINLMPGSESSFHLSGEFIINKNYMDSLAVDSVVVFQEDQEIYRFIPYIKSTELSADEDSVSYVKYLFGTVKGLKIKKEFNPDLKTDVLLNFFIGNEKIQKEIKDLPVEKAY